MFEGLWVLVIAGPVSMVVWGLDGYVWAQARLSGCDFCSITVIFCSLAPLIQHMRGLVGE